MNYKKKLYILTTSMILYTSNMMALPDLDEFTCMCKLSKFSAVQADILSTMLDRAQDHKTKPWLENINYNTNNQVCTPISPLLCAIRQNADKSLILALLKEFKLKKLELDNIYDANGYSMLSLAVKNNDMRLISLLLEYNHHLIWDKNAFKTSPLHIAAEQDHIHIVDHLLPYMTKELNVHSNNILGITPLSYIIKNNREKYAISLLLKFHPTYSIAYLGKNSYLTISIKQKMELLKYFLEHVLVLDVSEKI